jgi:hypothetical protein
VATSRDLGRQILQLEQGASSDSVKVQLGEPEAETSEGDTDGLSYGLWQLTFVDDRLTTRSKVIVPQGGHQVGGGPALSKKILGLQLGTKLGAVQATLGTPEMVYVIYEGEPQPVKILRYGAWELTFIDGRLSQRSQ